MPAVNAPTNAAAAGGNETRSTSSNLRVFASAPITAAEAASLTGHDDRAQCLDAARAVRFYPLHGLVRPVPRPPAVRGVHLVDGIAEVLVAD